MTDVSENNFIAIIKNNFPDFEVEYDPDYPVYVLRTEGNIKGQLEEIYFIYPRRISGGFEVWDTCNTITGVTIEGRLLAKNATMAEVICAIRNDYGS